MRRRELHPLSKVVRYLISVAFATSDRLCHAVTLCVAVHTASQIKPDSGLSPTPTKTLTRALCLIRLFLHSA